MNIVEAFAQYLVDHQLIDAALEQNLTIGRRPDKPDTIWNLKLQSPHEGMKTLTGEMQQPITIDVYRRSKSARQVYNDLIGLSEHFSSIRGLTLQGFTVLEHTTTGPFTDQDVDAEDREIGLLQVTLTTYKE